jgi:hypothetical protein
MPIMRILAAALAATLLGLPAMADKMPNIIPTHDVTGTYLFTGRSGTRTVTVTVAYSKAAGVLRITPPDGQSYILYDFAAHDAKVVMPQMQRYMDESQMATAVTEAAHPGAGGDKVSITQTGSETIAGHACRDFKATDTTKGRWSILCITADGVILSINSSAGTKAVARRISYDTVPAADVQLPPGYTAFQMPPGSGP